MSSISARALIGAFIAVVLVAGCGSNRYGSSSAFNFKQQTPASFNLASPSPNSASAIGEGQPGAGGAGGAGGQAGHAAPTTAPQQLQDFHIAINGDTSSQPGFYPGGANVYKGVVIVFTNHDSKPRSVVSNSGAFNSGLIAPGASWSYTANTLGRFDYADGTRPYQYGYFNVLAKP